MVDGYSRLWHLSNNELLTYFSATYPQSKPWQLYPLKAEIASVIQSTLIYKHSSLPATHEGLHKEQTLEQSLCSITHSPAVTDGTLDTYESAQRHTVTVRGCPFCWENAPQTGLQRQTHQQCLHAHGTSKSWWAAPAGGNARVSVVTLNPLPW